MDFKQYLDANIENYLIRFSGQEGFYTNLNRAAEDWSELNPEKPFQIWSHPSEGTASGYRFSILPKEYISHYAENSRRWDSETATLLLEGTRSECRQKHRDILAELGLEIEWRRPA